MAISYEFAVNNGAYCRFHVGADPDGCNNEQSFARDPVTAQAQSHRQVLGTLPHCHVTAERMN